MAKIKYNIINTRTGKQELLTSIFKNEDEADKWYNKYGKKMETEGKKLIRIVIEKPNISKQKDLCKNILKQKDMSPNESIFYAQCEIDGSWSNINECKKLCKK